jgi:Rieske [2Fe-2S] domain
MNNLNRRSFVCGVAAIAALGITKQSAMAATGIKTLANGKTEINLASNASLSKVGGVVELTISKYGKVAVVRTSKATSGYSVFNLACPHAGVTVKQSGSGWVCQPPGHGSEFALNGALKVGPASSALQAIKFTATTKAVTIA